MVSWQNWTHPHVWLGAAKINTSFFASLHSLLIPLDQKHACLGKNTWLPAKKSATLWPLLI